MVSLTACRNGHDLPDPSSEAYLDVVSSFYTGLAAIQSGESQFAELELTQATDLAPQEPAAWANLGLLALRRNDLDLAARHLERARDLAPESSGIQYLSGLLAEIQGQDAEAEAHYRRALTLDPQNLKARYTLAQLTAQQGGAGRVETARGLLDTLLLARPDNLPVLLEQARLAAEQGDAEALQDLVNRLAEQSNAWPETIREQLQTLQPVPSDGQEAATQLAILHNVLRPLPSYRQDLAAVDAPPGQQGEPITRFIRLPSPIAQPSPRDDSLAFASEALPLDTASGPWHWIGAVVLSDEALPTLLAADGQQVQTSGNTTLPFPGGPSAVPPALHGIMGTDLNYDFLMDLVLAGAGGLRIFQQDPPEAPTGAADPTALGRAIDFRMIGPSAGFTDVTARTQLPASITQAPYTGAWGVDLDLEGDIDLVLATPDGPPRVLRNNGDGTFSPWTLFDGVTGLYDFAWADLDADGDPDAALLDTSGQLHLFENQRALSFQPVAVPQPSAGVIALAVNDVNSDATLDLILLQADGTLHRLSTDGTAWNSTEIAAWPGLTSPLEVGTARLFVADLDNNGSLDLLVSTPSAGQLWLSDQEGAFGPVDPSFTARVFDVADLTGEGRLDLIGLTEEGLPVRLANLGTKPYHARSIRPRAAAALGDQRINPFGIGGEIELRTDLLFQKRPITGPVVHFGLGTRAGADVARIVWPNGDVQAEFDLESDQLVLTRQRLKGSCPWVFAYDGREMQFVTDFLWRSPLGLAVNAQETAGIMATEDWVKIRGDQLVPHEGLYEVRITAELWETHFFDYVSLLVVDHPAETEVYVDERFAFPPPASAVHATAPPRPVARAWDDRGRDVTDLVRARDERYLGGFALGPYQGVAQDHYVEIDLGDDVPDEAPLRLLATGWVRPTDSSINVALSQGEHAPPTGLSVEVPDGQGGWKVAKEGLGFPSGKAKTILIDVSGIFTPGTPHRLRLRTNLEVYWDALAWTVARPDTETHTQRLAPEVADLRYRGFSKVTEADRSSPELPHYGQLIGTTPRWRDLIGYYTRFGDVRELVSAVDDRYVIMNAGDELVFRFPAPPPPPAGWKRDFVLIGDGWVKDGDYNTTFSKTVLPLPSHDQPAYTTPPGRLEEDPVYRRYPQDWQTYHTRYVTPTFFHQALRIE